MLLGPKLSCNKPTDAFLFQSVTVPSFGLGKVTDGGGGMASVCDSLHVSCGVMAKTLHM